MATITITQALTADGAQVSAFSQQTLKYDVDNSSVITGAYSLVKITVNGTVYSFRATKTTADGQLESYSIDLTSILPSCIGFPPTTVTGNGLTASPTINIYTYTSANVQLATLAHPAFYLSFGYPKIGVSGGLLLNTQGKNMGKTIYHNGKFGFSSLGGVSFIVGTGTTNGSYTTGGYDLNFVYKNILGSEIAWLNSAGAWSFWNFRYLAKENESKSSNEIPVYAATNALMYAKTVDISREKKVSLYFDTIAVDDIHYEQLTEIAESPRVIYNGRVYRVKDSSSRVANCRQNLKFSLTLEIEENAVSY